MSEIINYENNSTSILKNNLCPPESTEEGNDMSRLKQMNDQYEYEQVENLNKEGNYPFKKDYKIERVRMLSEKLSKLDIQGKDCPNKLNKLESKFEAIEENIQYSYDTLKTKYNTLKEHTSIMKKRLEDELENKEDLKKNMMEKLKNLQNRVKSRILEEKDNFKLYTDNICAKLEAELIKCETELKTEDDNLLSNIKEIKENIRIELPEISNKISYERDEREKSLDLLFQDMNVEFDKLNSIVQEITLKRDNSNKNTEVAIKSIVESISESIYLENEKMMKFKNNIFCLLEETSSKISIK